MQLTPRVLRLTLILKGHTPHLDITLALFSLAVFDLDRPLDVLLERFLCKWI